MCREVPPPQQLAPQGGGAAEPQWRGDQRGSAFESYKKPSPVTVGESQGDSDKQGPTDREPPAHQRLGPVSKSQHEYLQY